MMDTPDKTTQPSPSSSFLSKFEDSPVFNYISTLSPIKPFKLGHSTQSFHLLSFSSPQALQTPPTYPKEPKIPRVNNGTDVPKNNCFEKVSEAQTAETSVAINPGDFHDAEGDKIDREVNVSSTDTSSKLISDIPRSMKYECDSPENNAVKPPLHTFSVAETEVFPVKFIKGSPKGVDSFENEMGVHTIQIEQSKEVCEWEKFVCEASDMLNCHSPTKESYHDQLDDRSADSGMLSFVATVLQPPNEHDNDPQKIESACPVIENHHMDVPLNKPGEYENSNERSEEPSGNARAVLAEEVVHYLKTEVEDKSCSQQQQTTRRRCLVYEMSGSRYRKLLADSTGSSPTKQAASSNTSNEKCSMASRPGYNKFSSALPGIGLHLNALAAASKDKIIVKRQTLTCRRQLISSPRTTSSFDPVIADTRPRIIKMEPEIVERESHGQKNIVQVSGNLSENSLFGEGVELPQISPKKKRCKSEGIGEADSCKRCNCKRSKCLKLYCECFAAGLYCVEPCNCQDCFNKPVHEDTVLETRRQIESRNPLAFAPKVIRSSGTPNSVDEVNKTPASARHKRGCNCKKSGCLKKYCECFQGGVGCSLSCRCEGCKNTFGRKEGTESIVFEETKFLQRNASDVSSHDVFSTEEENYDEARPEPSKNARPPVRRPFHFGGITGMVPRFPMLSSGPSVQPCASQRTDKSDETTFEEENNDNNNKVAVAEDDALDSEALKGDYLLPTTYIKSASPNCKRISPPHCDFETSPGWRSCRKLILRSIPSLPTLTREKESTELLGKLE